MSAAPDLMQRVADLERERNGLRDAVDRVRNLASAFADSPMFAGVAVVILDALKGPADGATH